MQISKNQHDLPLEGATASEKNNFENFDLSQRWEVKRRDNLMNAEHLNSYQIQVLEDAIGIIMLLTSICFYSTKF